MDPSPKNSRTPPSINPQNNQGQGSTTKGPAPYQPHATAGWNGKTAGSTAPSSKPYG